MDTIFALASARGKAGIAVIRLSGRLAFSAVSDLSGPLPPFRQADLREVTDGGGQVLDQALVLAFRAPHSFTGEDVVELHLHGGSAIVSAVLGVLGRISGLRLAEAGEFTRRALENGRLDLARVEGLGDLIAAETEAQRRQAQRLFAGALGKLAENWRRDLVRALALIEATIDFADEDVPVDVVPEVLSLIDATLSTLKHEAKGAAAAERLREGFEVAIVGQPNAGKSTLLNRLAGREAALTSEIAGTTRDVIEVRMDLAGLPVTFLDTAGLRETQDIVEAMGVDRAILRAEQADMRVFLLQDGASETLPVAFRTGDLKVTGKADLLENPAEFAVSARTGAGIDRLIDEISQELGNRLSGAATATHLRHRLAIEKAISLLDSARRRVLEGSDRVELASADLHIAVRALDSLVGRVDVEHLLDEIFASFCIGK